MRIKTIRILSSFPFDVPFTESDMGFQVNKLGKIVKQVTDENIKNGIQEFKEESVKKERQKANCKE